MTDFAVMEARQVDGLPAGEGWRFEPKWDGFRCLAMVAGGAVSMLSKSGKPLARYFPEVAARLARLPDVVLDGELLIPVDGALSFDALQLRLHPAASRVAKLAAATPARFMLFDRLDELTLPFGERRARLEDFVTKERDAVLRLSPQTVDRTVAAQWLARSGGALDGVICKRADEAYQPGERAMFKVKRMRTADCVVGGYRLAQDGAEIASLLLGLYAPDGLRHVGHAAGLAALDRVALKAELEALAANTSFAGDVPGGPSRWRREANAWFPVRPERVAEVRFDHASAGRLRHGAAFLRWRPDKEPDACQFDQLAAPPPPPAVGDALGLPTPAA